MSSINNIKENYYARSEINQRDNNEDSFLAFQFSPSVNQKPITTLAVADGMGGHQHGEHISTEGLRRFSHAVVFQKNWEGKKSKRKFKTINK